MRADEFIKMMAQDNETRTENKALYADVIDCMEMALSQSPADTEIDGTKNIEDSFKLIEKAARKSPDHCCGPFQAAEILAQYLGVKYCRATKKYAPVIGGPNVDLDDFI